MAALAQQAERPEHVVGALDGGHPADPADREPILRDAERGAELVALLRPCMRSESSMPRRTTAKRDAGATPISTSSSRISGLTATSASVSRASARSIRR